MTNSQLTNQSIAILGFGKEGQAVYNYFSKKNFDIDIYDQKPIDFENNHGKNYIGFDLTSKSYDRIFKSPGLSYHKVQQNTQENVFFDSLINLVLGSLDRSKVIAVTGTKGKSSIASLVYHVLTKCGYKAELLGNIGNINLELVDKSDPDCYYIFELSSFQTEFLEYSPHIAIFCSLFVDHQDVHASMQEYILAKLNLIKNQVEGDLVICSKQFLEAIENYGEAKYLDSHQVILPSIISEFDCELQGSHNQVNIGLVHEALLSVGLESSQIKEAIKTYTPLTGRLEKVASYNGVDFYSDDLATIPEATIAGIESFEGHNLTTLIVGGYDKGLDYTELASYLPRTNIKNYVYFDPTGSIIVSELDPMIVEVRNASSMQEAVSIALELTREGEICLLSCGSASFGMFESAYHRGELYRQEIIKQTKK